jgi:hypothetical protein
LATSAPVQSAREPDERKRNPQSNSESKIRMKSQNKLPVLDLAAVMDFARRPDEIVLCRCTDGAVLIDYRPDPTEVVGFIPLPVIRTTVPKGWFVQDWVFAATPQGQMAESCYFIDFAPDHDLSELARTGTDDHFIRTVNQMGQSIVVVGPGDPNGSPNWDATWRSPLVANLVTIRDPICMLPQYIDRIDDGTASYG